MVVKSMSKCILIGAKALSAPGSVLEHTLICHGTLPVETLLDLRVLDLNDAKRKSATNDNRCIRTIYLNPLKMIALASQDLYKFLLLFWASPLLLPL